MRTHNNVAIGILALIACSLAVSASAGVVTWRVMDHPAGALADPTYMLRLGVSGNDPNTFTVASPGTGAFLTFNPSVSTTEAFLTGTIQHNRGPGGPLSGGLYDISATFTINVGDGTPSFSDPDGPGDRWYGANPNDAIYANMLDDLLNGSDDTTMHDTSYRTDLDRIYFDFMDVTLTHVGGLDTYGGPMMWDEFPNASTSDKQFFIQKDHRVNTGDLIATGWLEVSPDNGRARTSDFLLKLTPHERVPEPGTLGLLALGLGAFGATRRRS